MVAERAVERLGATSKAWTTLLVMSGASNVRAESGHEGAIFARKLTSYRIWRAPRARNVRAINLITMCGRSGSARSR